MEKSMPRHGRSVAFLLFLGGALLQPVAAQEVRSSTQRLMLGANFNGSSLTVEDGDTESGGGGGFMVGWGVSRRVALFFRADLGNMEISHPEIDGEYILAMGDLGVRVSFGGPQRRFVPYLIGAFTGMTASADIFIGPLVSADVEVRGGGLTIGGGFHHYFTPTLALDLQLLVTGGQFNEVEIGTISSDIDELEANAARLNIGLAWYPLRGR
jgi:hypothetical protein